MFFVVIPGLFGGFGNYFMPLQIGAPDMAFPRLNNLSFWMYVAGTSLASLRCCQPGGNGQQARAWAGCFTRRFRQRRRHVHGPRDLCGPRLGAVFDLGAINMITTFLNMRAPGMTLFKVPLFSWSIFVTAWLILLALPVLAGAITMLADRPQLSARLL